jgi:hypothetical protein
MDAPFGRRVQSVRGSGQVFHGEIYLASVTYELRVEQQYRRLDAAGDTYIELPGDSETSGLMAVVAGQRDLIGKDPLLLSLTDGRRCRITDLRGDPISGVHAVAGPGAPFM